MGNALETFLAKLTGRSSWPSVKATVASHLLVAANESQLPNIAPEDETTDIFRYEVDGTEYIRPIHEVVGDTPLATGDRVLIQYNPKRPSQCYYAPNNQLAARATVALVLAATAALIAFFVHFHR
jgi:hypothetical protein